MISPFVLRVKQGFIPLPQGDRIERVDMVFALRLWLLNTLEAFSFLKGATAQLLLFVTVMKIGYPLKVMPRNLVFCPTVYALVETIL